MKEKNYPLVSVIVPCYNHERFVEQTIQSVINQTYKNIELIVIDDGSKDKSPEILQKLSEKYNFYFEKQENIGLPATLNKMIKMAKGKYISLIASDDIKTLDKIEILVDEFKLLPEEYAVVCGNAKFIDDEGKEIFLEKNGQQYENFLERYAVLRTDFDYQSSFGEYHTLLKSNYIPAMATMIKKEALFNVELFDENICVEDWSMWLKLAKIYKMKYVDTVVAYYRWHESNSIKIMTDRLKVDELKTLEREHSYCFSNDFSVVWEQKYYGELLYLLKSQKYAILYKCINSNNIFIFSLFLIKKGVNRIFRLFHEK